MTDLSGTLQRMGPNSWQWCDGTPEPRVYDRSPDRWHFVCRHSSEEKGFVEIPVVVAKAEMDLNWVYQGARVGKYRLAFEEHASAARSRDPYQAIFVQQNEPSISSEEESELEIVILVPFDQWRVWCRANPAGAEWDERFEKEIRSKALSLGLVEDNWTQNTSRYEAPHANNEPVLTDFTRVLPGFVPK